MLVESIVEFDLRDTARFLFISFNFWASELPLSSSFSFPSAAAASPVLGLVAESFLSLAVDCVFRTQLDGSTNRLQIN